MLCPWCKQREANLLCDGQLPDGRTCNASVCSGCATNHQKVFVRLARRNPATGSRCTVVTTDTCPACTAAGYGVNFGGVSAHDARQLAEAMLDLRDQRSKKDAKRQGALF